MGAWCPEVSGHRAAAWCPRRGWWVWRWALMVVGSVACMWDVLKLVGLVVLWLVGWCVMRRYGRAMAELFGRHRDPEQPRSLRDELPPEWVDAPRRWRNRRRRRWR